MKTLNEMKAYLESDFNAEDVQLAGLFMDSRAVVENSVFVAIQGEINHGLAFLEQAIKQGAVCVLSDQPVQGDCSIPVIVDEGLKYKLSALAKWFYDDPSSRVKLIGVTGTNGKTSTVHYLAQLLSENAKVAIMGTLGNGIIGSLKPTANTTLETLALNHFLYEFVRQGVDYVVMEVSSHAIALGRIAGLKFEVLALTQVTRDHLDFHETEQHYRQSKKDLFLNYHAEYWVLNSDDTLGGELTKESVTAEILTYAKYREDAHLFFKQLKFNVHGFSGQCFYDSQCYEINVSLMGEFNAENLLCALGICMVLGVSWSQIESVQKRLKPVAGRMEPVYFSPSVLVDYAHTPDALKSVLIAVKQHLSSLEDARLWVVFGCGGNRDQGKRSLMGQIAENLADRVVVTDDNPRYENPEKITEDILQGMTTTPLVIHNRSQAIQFVAQEALPSDIVVVAGKGHEDYQEIQGIKYPMQDENLIRSAFDLNKESQNNGR